jgi:protein-S-isoprenylcysteine O-methyltransferase Ste14
MNKYEKIFGTGPRGLFISALLFFASSLFEKPFALPSITDNDFLRYTVFCALSALAAALIVWSVRSLPPSDRGNKLITAGAFKYFRHPLYAAFLTFFDFGLAVLMNNWIYILWALVQRPVWHWNIKGEEKLMGKEFPGEYEKYCAVTGRFFPAFWKNEQ